MNFLAFAEEQPANNWGSMIIIIALIAVLLVMVFVSGRSQKKRQKQMMEMNMKLKVGDRIKSIGGIVGTIEQITEADTFIIRTGDHLMEIDRQAVYAEEAPAAADVETEETSADEAPQAESQPTEDSQAPQDEDKEDEVKH